MISIWGLGDCQNKHLYKLRNREKGFALPQFLDTNTHLSDYLLQISFADKS